MESSKDAKTDSLTSKEINDSDQKIKALLRQRSLLFWLEANKRKSNTIARLHEK